MYETFDEALEAKIAATIKMINDFIADGWSRTGALQYAQERSAFGAASWAKVVNGIAK